MRVRVPLGAPLFEIMYKVTLDIPRRKISVECNTLEAVRSVGVADIQKMSIVVGYNGEEYKYKYASLLISGPEFLKMDAHELAVGPPIIWKDAEEFVQHALRQHAKKLAKSNLLPLSRDTIYKIVGQDRQLRDSSLSKINEALVELGVLKATV